MGIKAGYVVPHPPLIIPSVGRGEEQGIAQTISAYKEVARRIATLCPETIVVSSPHVTAYRDVSRDYQYYFIGGYGCLRCATNAARSGN